MKKYQKHSELTVQSTQEAVESKKQEISSNKIERDETVTLDGFCEFKKFEKKAVMCNELIGGKVIYDNQYEYYALGVLEDNTDLISPMPDETALEPLKSIKFKFKASLPKDVEGDEKSLAAIFTVNGTEYEYKIR